MIKKILVLGCVLLLAAHASSGLTKVANDPTHIGVGARPLGLGKAFVGSEGDPSSIFMNPAGLTKIERPQYTSMAGKFINEMDYTMIGTVVPLTFGRIGVAYVNSGIGFTAPSVEAINVGGEIRYLPSSTEGVSYNYGNSALLLAWGRDVFENLSVGLTGKFMFQNLSGPGVSGGSASGMDMNLGLLYQPHRSVSVGLTQVNFLPFSAGGKLVWASGNEEAYPTMTSVGLHLNLIGDDGLMYWRGQEIGLYIDGDFYFTRSNVPSTYHFGLEWSPMDVLDMRLGIDQDTVGGIGGGQEVANNLTGGVGLWFKDFRFDYAYHAYFDVAESTTHYFSLSYGVEKWKKPETYISIISPADKSVLYDQEVKVVGKVIERGVSRVVVADKDVDVQKDGSFELVVPLALKKNPIRIYVYGWNNALLEIKTIRVLQLATFRDLAEDYWAKMPVEQLATLKVVSGYPDETFRPDNTITRAELTTLMVKLRGGEVREVEEQVFSDVPAEHWAAKYVKEAVEEGLVTGYPDGTFRPKNPITRAEGVTVIARFDKLLAPKEKAPAFPDVPGRHWAFNYITAAYEAGMLSYLEGKNFEPSKPLTRGETAEILARTSYGREKIGELMDFETGY